MRVNLDGTWSMGNFSISACKGDTAVIHLHFVLCKHLLTSADYAVGLQRQKRTQRASVKLWIGLASC